MKRNQGYVVEIDTSKNDAYTKTKQLIEELKADNKEITSYRFFNMGKNDSSQKFRDILSALPERLPQLELFFDASATNTSSLIALEDKYIDELSLYTLGNSLFDSWSLNPSAIKRTAWVNSIDYNVSFNFKKNTDVATRLTIDTLAFEETDYLKGHSRSI
ncbi:putative immunoglobulin-blocking virulence protein [Mycoplasmopsis felis]|uniref:putative immunoglobulin-blocking virulence protein n=1 Tax=Mycoplasmopsis felis TaxID=33923 RepID=UPI0021AE3B3D|nr:putative immunoglobulin-blocking virulence protein [Mycoplasmopsis felis]UWV84520.1 putative immunoglobulin-blocking virulence protein [Mycoplasmopsis felis]